MTIPRFWREIASRYNLIGTKCTNCKAAFFPPRTICPTCHRKSIGKLESFRMSGRGKVVTYTVVHEAPETFEMQKPYIMAVIEMAEGPKLTAQIIDCKEDEVKIGMEVESTFRKLHEEGHSGMIHYGYKFRPIR